MTKTSEIIDGVRIAIRDIDKEKYSDDFILMLINQKYKEIVGGLGILHYKDTITGDGTARYDLTVDSNLTYEPAEIKRVFVDGEEIGRVRGLTVDI